jgi:hypothetical protein
MFGFGYQPPIISSIRLENLEVSAQAAADTAVSVKNTVQGLHDLTLQYRNDAEYFYTQVQQFQEGDYVTQLDFDNRLSAFRFDELTEIPASFTPSAHRHDYNELDNVPVTFAPKAHGHAWSEITGKPSEFEPAEHAHSWLQIEGKPGTFPPEMHYHDWPSITNKPSVYPAAAHQHSWPDITGKPLTFAPKAHGHVWGEIGDKPDVYHAGNLNINRFKGGVPQVAVAGVAFRRDSSRLRMFLPINLNSPPPSISVVGTFEVIGQNYSIVVSNVNAEKITLLSSTERVLQLDIAAGDNVFTDEIYYLRPKFSYSEIRVDS